MDFMQLLQVQRMVASILHSTWKYVHLKVDFDLEWPSLDRSLNLKAMLVWQVYVLQKHCLPLLRAVMLKCVRLKCRWGSFDAHFLLQVVLLS